MKKIGILLSTLSLFSCKNSVDEIKVSDEATLNTQQAEALLQNNQNTSVFNKNLGVLDAANMAQLPTTSSSGVILNPPHGEPGHRCDIPVGSPLPNTNQAITQIVPVGENEALPQVSSNHIVTPQPQTSQVMYDSRGVKLNPPHGEPDHRCDIPVGAPLDSKPVEQVAQQTQQNTAPQVIQQQVVVEPQDNSQQNVGVTAEGFSGKPNPPHGEPGHRCDIAVGAILP